MKEKKNHNQIGWLKGLALAVCAVLLPWGLPVLQAGLVKATGKFKLTGPVTVAMTAPISGSTVSNRITLGATASSTAGAITRVEFYDVGPDGKTNLVGVVNGTNQPIPIPPKGLKTTTL